MTDVQKGRLEVNHTFPDKEMLLMWVAEEANLQGVNLFCSRSDLRDYTCTGSKFCVKALVDWLGAMPFRVSTWPLSRAALVLPD